MSQKPDLFLTLCFIQLNTLLYLLAKGLDYLVISKLESMFVNKDFLICLPIVWHWPGLPANHMPGFKSSLTDMDFNIEIVSILSPWVSRQFLLNSTLSLYENGKKQILHNSIILRCLIWQYIANGTTRTQKLQIHKWPPPPQPPSSPYYIKGNLVGEVLRQLTVQKSNSTAFWNSMIPQAACQFKVKSSVQYSPEKKSMNYTGKNV